VCRIDILWQLPLSECCCGASMFYRTEGDADQQYTEQARFYSKTIMTWGFLYELWSRLTVLTSMLNLPRSAIQQTPLDFTRMFLLFKSRWAIPALPTKNKSYHHITEQRRQLVAVCSAVVNNGLDISWSLYIGPLWPTNYWNNTTAFLQHKPQTGCHKTVRNYLILNNILYNSI